MKILLPVLMFFSMPCMALPDYNFSSGVRISGTNLAVGSKYRFSNVKSGLDAIVTIVSFSAGISLNQLDGPSGYAEAFQPVLKVAANSNGYAEFKIEFVNAGTTTLKVMPKIPATLLDVDGTLGGGDVFEQDMVQMTSASSTFDYDMSSPELSINASAGWVTGKNVRGIDYPSVDTTAKGVMFTVTNYNTSSVIIRIGANNKTATQSIRNTSVYFSEFIYNNSILPTSAITAFTASYDNSRVDIRWSVDIQSAMASITLEKSIDGGNYIAIYGEKNRLNLRNISSGRFSDNSLSGSVMHYRLKLVNDEGRISYSRDQVVKKRGICASIIISTAAGDARSFLHVNATRPAHVVFEGFDLRGNRILFQEITLDNGKNHIALERTGALGRGIYVGRLISAEETLAFTFFKE